MMLEEFGQKIIKLPLYVHIIIGMVFLITNIIMDKDKPKRESSVGAAACITIGYILLSISLKW